jgi:hypothetical protein
MQEPRDPLLKVFDFFHASDDTVYGIKTGLEGRMQASKLHKDRRVGRPNGAIHE